MDQRRTIVRRRTLMPSWYVLVLLSSGIVMNEMYGVAERSIGASVACVYWYIADYQAPHPRFLPPGTVLTEADQDGDAATTQVVTPDGNHRSTADHAPGPS